MTLYALIFILIVLVLVIIFVTRPLFTTQEEIEQPLLQEERARQQAEYESVLDHIRELDFDFNLGKLTPLEHEEQRGQLIVRAAELRRQLQPENTPPQA